MAQPVVDIFGDFDFSRTDKLYHLTIPTYKIQADVVFYHFQLKDLIRNETFYRVFRYK
jgi:hypothetical protein